MLKFNIEKIWLIKSSMILMSCSIDTGRPRVRNSFSMTDLPAFEYRSHEFAF